MDKEDISWVVGEAIHFAYEVGYLDCELKRGYSKFDKIVEKVLEYLETAYPFKVKLSSSNNSIEVNSQEQITIEVSWPYESGNDELDTYWGNKAYDFHKANPDSPSILLVIKISASQINET